VAGISRHAVRVRQWPSGDALGLSNLAMVALRDSRPEKKTFHRRVGLSWQPVLGRLAG